MNHCWAPRAIQVLKLALARPAVHEMVSTGLPEAMLINSTTLTMTWMAPSRTALWGLWALVSAVQLVQRPADLNRAHPIFYLNLAKNSGFECLGKFWF